MYYKEVDTETSFRYNLEGISMKKIAILILFLFPMVVSAQVAPDLQNKSYVSNSAVSLFDPSKLTMNHSYSLSYYSGGGRSGNIGLYMNSIEYAFSDPLKIRIDLGYLHTPSRLFSGSSSTMNNGIIIPGISLDWQPNEHFNFRLDYRQRPQSFWQRQDNDYEPFYQGEENR